MRIELDPVQENRLVARMIAGVLEAVRPTTEMLTVAECAKRVGVTKGAIYHAIDDGRLNPIQRKPKVLITEAELRRYREK